MRASVPDPEVRCQRHHRRLPRALTAGDRIGTLVCWDQWYPEAARLTALAGADTLFYPSAIGWHPREKAAHGEAQASS